MSTLSPITNTFRELNNLLVGQQRFNAQMEQQEKNFALQSQLQNEQIKDQMQSRELRQFEIDEKRKHHTPRALNLYSIAPKTKMSDKHVYSNPQVMQELAGVLDPEGKHSLQFSRADGLFKTPDGGIFEISPARVSELAPALVGIVDRRTDMMSMNMDKLQAQQVQMNGLRKQLRGSGSGKGAKHYHNQLHNAGINTKISALQSTMAQTQAQLSPANAYQHYRQKKNDMAQRSHWALGQGNSELAKYFNVAMQEAASMEKEYLSKMLSASGEGGGKNVTQRLSFWMDENNKMQTLVHNVPRSAQGEQTPQMYGAPKGWKWLESHAGDVGKASSRPDRTVAAHKILAGQYGGLYDPNGTGNIIGYNPEYNQLRKTMEDVLAEVSKQAPKDVTAMELHQATSDVMDVYKNDIVKTFAEQLDESTQEDWPERQAQMVAHFRKTYNWDEATIMLLLTEAGVVDANPNAFIEVR